jgi:hypothetical protein
MQRLCLAARIQGISSPRGVDRACAERLLVPAAQESDDNLLFVRESILRSEVDPVGLLDLYARIWRGRKVKWEDTNPLLDVLRLSGLARVENGLVKVRNRIYATVFNGEWVRTHLPGSGRRRQQRAFRFGLATALGLVALIVITGFFWRRYLDWYPPTPPPSRDPRLTNNAFIVYQAAARMLTENALPQEMMMSSPDKFSAANLERILAANTNTLILVRMGLRYPCRFPAVRSADLGKDYAAFKNVTDLLVFEGDLKEQREDWAGAAETYLDIVHFGEDLCRGTPLVGRLIGIACNARGVTRLGRLLPKLDAATSQRIAMKMRECERATTGYLETVREERNMCETEFLEIFRTPGWRFEPRYDFTEPQFKAFAPKGFLDAWFQGYDDETTQWEKVSSLSRIWIHSWTRSKRALVRDAQKFYDLWLAAASRMESPPVDGKRLPPDPKDVFLKRMLTPTLLLNAWRRQCENIARFRLLQTAGALRVFQIERGVLPRSLEELVPGVLEGVPHDPFSPREPLIYRVEQDRAILYSSGANGKNDGGPATGQRKAENDDVALRDLALRDTNKVSFAAP